MKKFFKALVLAMIIAGGFTIAQFDEPSGYEAVRELDPFQTSSGCEGLGGGCD